MQIIRCKCNVPRRRHFLFSNSFIKIFFRADETHTQQSFQDTERERVQSSACSRRELRCVCVVYLCVCVCCRYVCFAIVFRANAAQTAKRNLNLFFSPVALTITCKVTLTVLGSGCGCGRGRGSSQHIHSDS